MATFEDDNKKKIPTKGDLQKQLDDIYSSVDVSDDNDDWDLEGSQQPESASTQGGEVERDDTGQVVDVKIPEGWNPDMSVMSIKSRSMDPNTVRVPSTNIDGKTFTPTVSLAPTETERLQNELIEKGEQYSGKNLKQLMDENPGVRPAAMMQAINAYNKANGRPEMSYLDSLAFFGSNDPGKSKNELKKDKRRMMWAEGINGIADVLQSVVNLSTASDNNKHNAADMTNYHRQLRKNLDDERLKRLDSLMSSIKADNDARRAAYNKQLELENQIKLKQMEWKNQIKLKQMEWKNPKLQLEMRKILKDIELANIKSKTEKEKYIRERLITMNMPAQLAADYAKAWADVDVKRSQTAYNNARKSEVGKTSDKDKAMERYYDAMAEGKELKNDIFRSEQ